MADNITLNYTDFTFRKITLHLTLSKEKQEGPRDPGFPPLEEKHNARSLRSRCHDNRFCCLVTGLKINLRNMQVYN